MSLCPHDAGATRTPLATHQRARQVQTSMPGSPVAVRAVACLPGRWLSPRLGQHMSLSAVSRCPDVRGTTNLQQLWRQNLCSCWTSVMELTTSPAAQSRHQLRTVQTTAERSSLRERWTRRSVTFDMQRYRKRFTYLLTYSNVSSWKFFALPPPESLLNVNVILIFYQLR